MHEFLFWSSLSNTGYLVKLDSGGGAWFYLNLVSQNLVTPQGRTIPSEEWIGVGWEECGGRRMGRSKNWGWDVKFKKK